MNEVIGLIGRRLRLGVVGGGRVSPIGPVHRIAARLDDGFEITAAVLASDAAASRELGRALGIPRPYGDLDAMLATEAARADGIDALAIMTPNHLHHPFAVAALDAGLHVVCDKPMTTSLADALDLAEKVRASGRVFALTHNYGGYPMVRQARAMVAAGELGEVRQVNVTYAQGQLARRIEVEADAPERLLWRLDPARGGPSPVLGDIGTHAHHLACFMLGQPLEAVAADLAAIVPGRDAHDYGGLLLRFAGGARGVMWVTQAAPGCENQLRIEIYGEEAGLAWDQNFPNQLRLTRQWQPAQTLSRGAPDLHPAAKRATRTPLGHPEGFHEAFANLYRDIAHVIAAGIAGKPADPLATTFPTIEDGVRGMRFVEASIVSSAAGGRWTRLGDLGPTDATTASGEHP